MAGPSLPPPPTQGRPPARRSATTVTASAPPGLRPESPLQRNARRYGPLVAIAVVVGLVVVVVARMPGPEGASTAGSAGPARIEESMRPIGWSEAKAKNLSVTFGPGCDQDPGSKQYGRIAIPSAFAPECFAQRASNG